MILRPFGPSRETTQAGAHNGHVMNLGHGIEADTPEPHAKFFVDTVQGFRAK